MLIFKIVPRALWREAERSGSFTGAPVDLKDGYIHFSSAAQLRDTARLHFAGQDDLLIVACDAEAFGAALRWEPSRGGDLFPHLHAALPVNRAAWIMPLPIGPDGTHEIPSEAA